MTAVDLDLIELRNSSERGFRVHPKFVLALLDNLEAAEQREGRAVQAFRLVDESLTAEQGAKGRWRDRAQAAEARLAKVQALADRLDRRGCLSCSSMPGGDDLADYLREALTPSAHDAGGTYEH